MRKLLLLGVVLAALVVACENKNPAGPTGVGPGGVTVTQTTSSTTTTTSVVGNLSRRYLAFQPASNVPADMTLFFQLLTTQSLWSSVVQQLPFLGSGPRGVTANENTAYKVTGVYLMKNATTGAVNGQLSGASNPLETGGQFAGTLTAKVGGCTAEREFSGPLEPQTLTWTGGRTLQDCSGSPLFFSSLTMLNSDAPLPTTTVPTTTTAVVCTYELSPTSLFVPATGTTGQTVVVTKATCPWTAQSFAGWITVSPDSGIGTAAVKIVAAANTGPARTATLVIAGLTFIVTQAGV